MTLRNELGPLLQRAAAGDERAAEELLQTFGPRILRVVRMRLGEKLRRNFDSADFVQAVWQSFFGHIVDFAQFESPAALCAYLVKMAERKVLMTARREGRQKRGADRRQPLDSAIMNSSQFAVSDASPSQVAIAEETWRRLMSTLSIRDQRILHLRSEGCTQAEIAQAVGVAESTVRRVLDSLKQALGVRS